MGREGTRRRNANGSLQRKEEVAEGEGIGGLEWAESIQGGTTACVKIWNI